jgi:hypothetical protein
MPLISPPSPPQVSPTTQERGVCRKRRPRWSPLARGESRTRALGDGAGVRLSRRREWRRPPSGRLRRHREAPATAASAIDPWPVVGCGCATRGSGAPEIRTDFSPAKASPMISEYSSTPAGWLPLCDVEDLAPGHVPGCVGDISAGMESRTSDGIPSLRGKGRAPGCGVPRARRCGRRNAARLIVMSTWVVLPDRRSRNPSGVVTYLPTAPPVLRWVINEYRRAGRAGTTF